MKTVIIYSTLGCHLCEQALEILKPLLGDDDRIEEVDISESDQLMEQYGIRIPVIKREDNGQELGWPFDEQQILSWLV